MVAMDLFGPLAPGASGNRYVLVVVDMCDRWVEAYALPDATTASVVHALSSDYLPRHGAPAKILCDRGPAFSSAAWTAALSRWGTTLVHSSPYHPQGNGLAEREVGSLLAGLKRMVESEVSWEQALPSALLGRRFAPHARLGVSPFQLCYGREPRMPLDPHGPQPPSSDQAEWIARARAHAERAAPHLRPVLREFKVGDFVMLRDPRASGKLSPRNKGPFTVLERLGPVLYRLQGVEKLVNVERLTYTRAQPQEAAPSPTEPNPPADISRSDSFAGAGAPDDLDVPEHAADGAPSYTVEKVVNKRRHQGRTLYLVKWRDYALSDNTWEPASSFHEPWIPEELLRRHREEVRQHRRR
jgi:hypothetical protein